MEYIKVKNIWQKVKNHSLSINKFVIGASVVHAVQVHEALRVAAAEDGLDVSARSLRCRLRRHN